MYWQQRLRKILPFLLIAGLFLALRLPSFLEPHWYNDEGIYAAVASQLRQGEILYVGTWDHKPPGIFLIYWAASFAGTQQLLLLKLLISACGLASLYLGWRLLRQFAPQLGARAQFVLILFLTGLVGSPLLEGNIANAENFFIVASAAGFLLAAPVLINGAALSWRRASAIGGLFGLAILLKFHPALELAGLLGIIFAFAVLQRQLTLKLTAKLSLSATLAALPLAASGLVYLVGGHWPAFYEAVIGYNFGYADPVGRTGISFGVKLLLIGGVLLIVAALHLRKHLERRQLVVFTWYLLALLGAGLSSRPFLHYLLQLAIPLVLLCGIVYEALRSRQSILLMLMLGATSLGLLALFFPLASLKTGATPVYGDNYYLAGYRALLGDDRQWQEIFASNMSPLQEIAYMAAPYDPETLWVWTDKSWYIADLQLRWPLPYVVRFHIDDHNLSEVVGQLEADLPAQVIVDKHADMLPEIQQLLDKNYYTIQETDRFLVVSLSRRD